MGQPTRLSQEDLNRLRHAQARAHLAQAQAQWEDARLEALVAGLAARYQVGPGEFIQLDGFINRLKEGGESA